MNAIERTLDELPRTTANTLYEQAYALRMGDGVRVNFRAAHRFFMLAALMGERAAFYQLGMMNLRGEGRPVDKLHAAMWLKLGVGRDEPRAARNLEMVAADLTRAQMKAALALAEEFPRTARAFAAALGDADADALVYECADLWFHSMIMLAQYGLKPQQVLDELARREGLSGIEEKANRKLQEREQAEQRK